MPSRISRRHQEVSRFYREAGHARRLSVRSVRCASSYRMRARACVSRAPRARRPLWVTRKTTCRCGAIASRAAFTCSAAEKIPVVQVSYGYGLFTGGLGAHFGAEAAGAMVVPMSTGNTRAPNPESMKDFGVTILCATPSYALLMAGCPLRKWA